MYYIFQSIIFYNVLACFLKISKGLQCLDRENNPVDWIVAYKFPAINHQNNLIKHGLFYIYMTSDNYSEWISTDIPINSSNSLIANIISNLYKPQKNDFSILYNDESPFGVKNSEKGHNKGVVLVNYDGGLWFIHSVPKFPRPDYFHFPETGMKFGQSFLCISLNLENMDKVGIQLQYNEPYIYSANIPKEFESTLPNLVAAGKNDTVSNAPWYHQAEITSLMGSVFTSFAKSNRFGKDIYEDWVAPVLQSNLLVETWPDGPGRLDSDCSKPFKVINIQSIFWSKLNLVFNTTHDHSKWAVSAPKKNIFWTCIGDINRAGKKTVPCGIPKLVSIDVETPVMYLEYGVICLAVRVETSGRGVVAVDYGQQAQKFSPYFTISKLVL